MLNVNIICVGNLKEQYWRDACAEYAKRLGGFCRFCITEVNESRLPKSYSDADIAKVTETEGARILEKIPSASFVIAMCIEGKEMSSDLSPPTRAGHALRTDLPCLFHQRRH